MPTSPRPRLRVGEDDTGGLFQEGSEEVTRGEMTDLEQQHTAEAEAGEKETVGEGCPRKRTAKGLADTFADLNKLLRHLRTWNPTLKGSH